MAADTVDWLFSLAQFGIKFGLHNIRAIVNGLDHPEQWFQSVHVAGTNGKGSVTAIVETALRASGHKTGRYTSPHLLDLTERFAIDGAPVSHADMESAVEAVRAVVDRLRADGTLDAHPTFFEVTTATAFELFRRQEVDIAVCEVGLGGRLDATNVLTPVTCAITSIAFDHEQYLGHTLREIAGEKAGIIKPRTPVVVGAVDQDAADAIRRRADACDAPVVWAMDDVAVGAVVGDDQGRQRFALRTPTRDYGEVRLGLGGRHQVGNAVVAVRLLEEIAVSGVAVTPAGIVHALDSVRWPGRLERIDVGDGRDLLLDAAHNAAGAAALALHLASIGAPRPLVFAAMRDKDVASMLAALAPHVSVIVVTRASNPRSAEPEAIAELTRRIAPGLPVEIVDSPREALDRAWTHAPRIVVAGSIFLLADVMKELGRS